MSTLSVFVPCTCLSSRFSRSRQIEREEKLLQNFLARPELTINEAFDVDGSFFMTTLALIIMKPSDWEKHRLVFLQKLLLTAHVRSVNSPNDRTKYVACLSHPSPRTTSASF